MVLTDIPLEQVDVAQQAAQMRLQLFITGEVHKLLLETQQPVEMLRSGGEDSPLTPMQVANFRDQFNDRWKQFIEQYELLLAAGMFLAAAFPFGSMAIMHHHLVLTVVDAVAAPGQFSAPVPADTILPDIWRPLAVTEAAPRAPEGFFNPQLDLILKAVNQRVYSDGLNLSGRIWNLNAATKQDIDRIIYNALANGLSAWDTAAMLEGALGAGNDCPRWTEERLSSLTKADIAGGNRTGLITGSACEGQGVAYNALRLARTEIQASHHIAHDMLAAKMPWITEEQINLSPAHAKRDVCDDVVEGGREGKGIYKKGEIKLPNHPNCMCYKTDVLMDDDLFFDQLRGWMTGQKQWGEMDEYAHMIGGSVDVDMSQSGLGVMMEYWLWSSPAVLNSLFWSIANEDR